MVLCEPCSNFAGKGGMFQRSGISRHLQSAQHCDALNRLADQQARERQEEETHSIRDLGVATMNAAPSNLGMPAPSPIEPVQGSFASITTVNGVMYDRDGHAIVVPAGSRETDHERLVRELDTLMDLDGFTNGSGSSWLDAVISQPIEDIPDAPTRTSADVQHDLEGIVTVFQRLL